MDNYTEAHRFLSVAKSRLDSSLLLLKSRYYNDSVNRSYYAAFAAINMLHTLAGKTYTSHQQALGQFNKEYVASGILPKTITRALYDLFNDRQSADYDIAIDFDEESAKQSLKAATLITNELEKYCKSKFHDF